jgi:hypothetical protein
MMDTLNEDCLDLPDRPTPRLFSIIAFTGGIPPRFGICFSCCPPVILTPLLTRRSLIIGLPCHTKWNCLQYERSARGYIFN